MTDGHDGGHAAPPAAPESTAPPARPAPPPQSTPTPADVLAESTHAALTASAAATSARSAESPTAPVDATDDGPLGATSSSSRRRRRGSRGGRNRSGRPRPAGEHGSDGESDSDGDDSVDDGVDDGDGVDAGDDRRRDDSPAAPIAAAAVGGANPELPDPPNEGRVTDPIVAEEVLVRRPRIGDTRPAPPMAPTAPAGSPGRGRGARGSGPAGSGSGASGAPGAAAVEGAAKKRRRGGRGRGKGGGGGGAAGDRSGTGRQPSTTVVDAASARGDAARAGKASNARQGGGGSRGSSPVQAISPSGPVVLDAETLARRRGRERNGRPVGRYTMCVHVRPELTQVAVLEGRSLIEHFVSRPSDDVTQIHGNIYIGKVQNVLPGMEAAFVDIATPKNAVLYRGDVTYDAEDVEAGGRGRGSELRIEQMLRPKQLITCQVTKNPIGAKGARLTQEVSLPGRFVVLIPNSKTYGISKRLPDEERRRLRAILDKVKPAEHGVIVRTAAENVVAEELRADVERLLRQWEQVEALARRTNSPKLLYREPDLAVRVIREEFNSEYRSVVIDDRALYEEVRDYVASINPTLADRVEYYDAASEGLPLFEQFHVHEQVHKALDRKVWLPSGGSLIIEHTEALTVIDVNTGKNVGTTNLEETVFRNNLEAADEIARQLRLRDIGGIIVIDFIDMEIKENRHKVVAAFREALSRDKTRSQVFEISELGLVEMTRKRIGEGLLTAFTEQCPVCEGRGVRVDHSLID